MVFISGDDEAEGLRGESLREAARVGRLSDDLRAAHAAEFGPMLGALEEGRGFAVAKARARGVIADAE